MYLIVGKSHIFSLVTADTNNIYICERQNIEKKKETDDMENTQTYDLQKQYYKWEFGLGRRLTILYLLNKNTWIIHFAKTLLSGARTSSIPFLFLPFAFFCSLAVLILLRFHLTTTGDMVVLHFSGPGSIWTG